MFKKASDNSFRELAARSNTAEALRFGIDFLDDALGGIFQEDLILVGAPSGIGKTQLCCNIAMANLEMGKRVHYIALEASDFEIERRMKYPLVMERFFADIARPRIKVNFADWYLGKHTVEMAAYEQSAAEYFETAFTNLFTFYKGDRFGLNELIESVVGCADETDLIIIDHVHYFDFDDDNENRAIREIAKTVRTLALEQLKPIILVAHLRKGDKYTPDLVAGLEEFHGSSDLYKIATKVITLSPGKVTPEGNYETFFRVPKNRFNGSATRYVGRELFSPKKGCYERGRYELTWSDQKRSDGFEMLELSLHPEWSRSRQTQASGASSMHGHLHSARTKRYDVD